MILRLVLCVYLISTVRASEWQPYSFTPGPLRPLVMSETNVLSKPNFDMGFNPVFHSNEQVQGKHNHLLEITSQNTKCHSFKTMMTMARGILAYLMENPNKINYLHHLISFVQDEEENTPHAYNSNQFGRVVSIIDRDVTLPYHDKKVLRELLTIDVPKPDMKTVIVLNNELPRLNIPNCKNELMKLMEIAHDRYTKLAKYPTCQLNVDNPYYVNHNNQPSLPIDEPDFQNLNYIIDDNNKPNGPLNNPNGDDYHIKIQYILDKLKEGSYKNKPDKINELIRKILIGSSGPSNELKPKEHWPEIFPNIPQIPNGIYDQSQFSLIESTTKNIIGFETRPTHIVDRPNGEISINELMNYLLPFLTNNNSSPENLKLTDAILAILKSNGHDVTYSKIIAILELLNNASAGHMNPKLIEIILPLLTKAKNAPGPKVIQIIITLLKHKVHENVNPKNIELVLSLLKLNKDNVKKEKYQVLFSLIHPDENGEVNPKLIEIISYLLKVNENSTPNDKILGNLVTLLNGGNGLNPINVDILLHLLKINNNHRLPEQLYYKIIQFLIKFNENKKVVHDIDSIHFYYPIKHPEQTHSVDGKLLDTFLAKNPEIFSNLATGPHAFMPNQLNPNVPGVIELTYLLKHPKPFVYQPFDYVKYKLPLPTFVANLKHLLVKNPHLTSNPTKLYQDLIKISNVTAISPNLKGYSKDDILKLTFANGALIKTKIIDDTSVNFKEQIKVLQDLNSDVSPENILAQSAHIWNNQELKGETYQMDKFWTAVHPENSMSPLKNFGYSQILGLNKIPTPTSTSLMNVGVSDISQNNVEWSDTYLRESDLVIKKD